MTLKDFCKKYGLTIEQATGEEEFGGYLDLSSVTSIPEGFNPTVGGYLDLSSVTSIPEGFNPTVGGYLYLSSDIKYIGEQVKLPLISARYLWRNNG